MFFNIWIHEFSRREHFTLFLVSPCQVSRLNNSHLSKHRWTCQEYFGKFLSKTKRCFLGATFHFLEQHALIFRNALFTYISFGRLLLALMMFCRTRLSNLSCRTLLLRTTLLFLRRVIMYTFASLHAVNAQLYLTSFFLQAAADRPIDELT